MNIIFITYHYLHSSSGGAYASRAYINAFATIASDMTLLYPMKPGAEPKSIDKRVRLVPVWDRRSKLVKGLDIFIGWSSRYKQIDKLVGGTKYDVAVLDTSVVTHGVIDFFKNNGTRVITIHHNFQYEYFRDNARFPFRLPLILWSLYDERKAVTQSDLNFTLTEDDKISLGRNYSNGKEKIEVLGTFEYAPEDHPVFPDVSDSNFLITGNLSAIQTEQSLLPWIKDYYPILKEEFPDAKLTLAGRNPSKRLCDIALYNGIEVISSPEDMQPILAQAKYYICPTSLGGGLKLRVMDGLKTGLPVMCHKVSARGYEHFADKGVLFVYDNKATFRAQLQKLKTQKTNKKNTIRLYEQIFSFESGRNRLVKLLHTSNIY